MTNEKIIIQIEDEDILELIPGYMESRRNELDVLRDAITRTDFETLRGLGHKLKGSGGAYGFDRISEIGGNLEFSAKARDLPAIERQIADLQDFITRVEVVGI